jgi:hypothetical protein
MGCIGMGSCGTGPRVEYVSVERAIAPKDVDTGINPNPYNFKIVWASVVNGHTIMKVNYPNCTTYKGNKLLLLRGVHTTQMTKLDPHFFEGDHPVIARFEPTQEGNQLANLCAQSL